MNGWPLVAIGIAGVIMGISGRSFSWWDTWVIGKTRASPIMQGLTILVGIALILKGLFF
jgi:hypothetical protein